MAAKVNITREELENNYEYKVVKRMIMKEFPWVIDVIPPTDEKINNYNLIFLDLVIDPFKLQEETEWPLLYYVIKSTIWGRDNYSYTSPYLSAIYDITYEEGNDIHNEIESLMSQVSKSQAVPQDLKIKGERSFAVGSYLIPNEEHLPRPDNIILSHDKISQ